MSDHEIEFLARADAVAAFAAPYPASRAIPDWFRAMPPQSGARGETRTVKKCPPFLEALTCGYIIPVPADVRITRTATELKIDTAPTDPPLLDIHRHEEFPGAPFGAAPLLKFICPWIVKTPPGFSSLFVHPLNRLEAQIMPLAGVVETDTYYRPVAFPTLVLLQPNTELLLKAGTPLVQVVPFRREAWHASGGEWDHEKMAELERSLQANEHLYKEQHWQKKSFT